MNLFEIVEGLIGRATLGGRVGRLRSQLITLISVYSVASVVPSAQLLRLRIVMKSSPSARSVTSVVGSDASISF
jgi:hypothetical protein